MKAVLKITLKNTPILNRSNKLKDLSNLLAEWSFFCKKKYQLFLCEAAQVEAFFFMMNICRKI